MLKSTRRRCLEDLGLIPYLKKIEFYYCRPGGNIVERAPVHGSYFLRSYMKYQQHRKVRFLIQIFGSSTSAEQSNNWEIGTTSFSDLSHIDNECELCELHKKMLVLCSVNNII